MTRNATLLLLVLATGCEPRYTTCGVGGIVGPLVNKPLYEGPFVHRIASIEVLEGDYVAPPVTGTETPAELRFEERSWVADVGPGRIELVILSHGELVAVEDRCATHALLTDPDSPWDAYAWAHVAADEEVGQPNVAFDDTLAAIEPVFFDYGSSEEGPLVLDSDRLGFVLAADYVVRPSGCADGTCASTVRVRHRFRRPDAP